MKVWVTRTQPGADRQAADLRGAGHDPVVAPVLEIEPRREAPPPGPFHRAIFLSEHAVRWGLPALQRHNALAGAEVWAVGARTAAALREAGVAARVPDQATSEGLLGSAGLEHLAGQRVVLVRGAGGRELLAERLAARGAQVACFDCYRRVPAGRLDAEVIQCDAIIAASGDGLREAARLWFAAGGAPGVPVLVPSARVARLGVELGFISLHDCRGADSQAWLRGLAQLAFTGKT